MLIGTQEIILSSHKYFILNVIDFNNIVIECYLGKLLLIEKLTHLDDIQAVV
jgi:hypothetical protein